MDNPYTRSIIHEFAILYTSRVLQKNKHWFDGNLRYFELNGKLEVTNEDGSVISIDFVNKPVEVMLNNVLVPENSFKLSNNSLLIEIVSFRAKVERDVSHINSKLESNLAGLEPPNIANDPEVKQGSLPLKKANSVGTNNANPAASKNHGANLLADIHLSPMKLGGTNLLGKPNVLVRNNRLSPNNSANSLAPLAMAKDVKSSNKSKPRTTALRSTSSSIKLNKAANHKENNSMGSILGKIDKIRIPKGSSKYFQYLNNS